MEGGVSTLVRAFGCARRHRWVTGDVARGTGPGQATRVQEETSEPTPTGIIARIGSAAALASSARLGASDPLLLLLRRPSALESGPLPNPPSLASHRVQQHGWRRLAYAYAGPAAAAAA